MAGSLPCLYETQSTYRWLANPAIEAITTTLGLSDLRRRGIKAVVKKYTPRRQAASQILPASCITAPFTLTAISLQSWRYESRLTVVLISEILTTDELNVSNREGEKLTRPPRTLPCTPHRLRVSFPSFKRSDSILTIVVLLDRSLPQL